MTDPSGAVVPGAQVTVRHTETNLSAAAETDGEGRFRFPYLKVGPYEITIRKAGFADATRRLTLTIGAAFDLPVSLTLGTVEANVNVTAQATVLEAARSQIAGTISQAEVRNLPMNGRNFLDLALLVPGVSPTNVGSTQLFAETSAVPGQGISVGSQRNFSNNFIVDGLSANDDAAGLSGIPYGVDAVEQFQVVTSGGQAELGRALGGYINVVTKSGTNATRGDFYDYVRDDRFNAPNALSGKTLPMSQSQYGASLGGPIVRDRTFFFSNFEQRKLDQSGLVIVDPVRRQHHQRQAGRRRLSRRAGDDGRVSQPGEQHQLPGESWITRSAARTSSAFATVCTTSTPATPEAPAARMRHRPQRDWTTPISRVAFGNTMTLSARTVNETRAQFSYGDLKALPTDPIGPAVSIAGVTSFGTLSGSPHRTPQQDVPGGRQPLSSGGCARAAGGRGLPVQQRHDHVSAVHPRRLHVLVAREFPGGRLQQLRLHADLRHDAWSPRRIRTSASTRRTNGRSAPA